MGKSQKKKAMRRHNPVRVPDNHLPAGLAAADASSTKQQAILPIIQKMEAPESTDRRWACAAVSNLIQNDPSTRRLLQGKNIVGVLITRLSDNDEEVVVEAAGALRNLCIDGGYDLCGELFNKNVISPLKTFIPKISASLNQFLENPKSAPDNAKRLVYEFSDNVITILWCLSETSNKALNAVNDMSLVPFLMSFLASRHRLSPSPVVAAAQCLYVLTDDNFPAAREVKFNAGYVSCLVDIAKEGINQPQVDSVDPRTTMLQVLAAGVLRNVAPLPASMPAAQIDLEQQILIPLLQPIISSVSISELTSTVEELVAKEAAMPQVEKLSLKGTPKSDHKSEADIGLERTEQKLRTVQLSLEILTGVCATLPENEPSAENEEDGDDDEEEIVDDDDMDGDEQPEAEETESVQVESMDEAPIDTSASGDATFAQLSPLLDPLLHLIQPANLSFPPPTGLSTHPPTTSALSAVHVCAAECLNNLFLGIGISKRPSVAQNAQAGVAVWSQVWNALRAVGTIEGPSQGRRREMWETSTGVLWGVASVWKGALVPQEDEVKMLMQLCDNTQDDAMRVKCIGTLECLAQKPDAIDGNRIIATYLMQMLPTSSSPSPVGTESLVQVVSALIDIYSDETFPYDINFRQHGFLLRLTESVDGVKKAVKAIDRKKPGGKDLKARGEETRDNLIAFIQYRKKLKL